MLDLYDEFAALIGSLEAEGVDYAVCGGLAMAIHGFPRATINVDLVVPRSAAEKVLSCAHGLNYTIQADPMSLAGGKVGSNARPKSTKASCSAWTSCS